MVQDSLAAPVRLVSTTSAATHDDAVDGPPTADPPTGNARMGMTLQLEPAGTKLKTEECDASADRQRFSMMSVSPSKCKQGVSTKAGEACVTITFQSSLMHQPSVTPAVEQCATVLAGKVAFQMLFPRRR